MNNGNAERMAAQVVFPKLYAEKYYDDEEYKAGIMSLVEMGAGGFCLFGSNVGKIKMLVSELQARAETPLLFCGDYEWGVTMRHEDGTSFPHAMALGKANDVVRTALIASLIAKEAKHMGVHWNFAPVCDINSNPKNPIINIRAYGENKETVDSHSAAFIKGTQNEKVMACAKHFPGHGDTETDSHLSLPMLAHDLQRLEEFELQPFRTAIKAGVRSVMIGHMAVPALDDSGLPASLSGKVMGYLKNNMGFNGLIVSDALEMKSVSDNFSSGVAACMFIEAGGHAVLIPDDPFEAIAALKTKMSENEGFQKLVLEAGRKISAEKKWAGLIPYFAKDQDMPASADTEKIALDTAFRAIVDNGQEGVIPLTDDKRLALFSFLQTEGDLKSASVFYHFMGQALDSDMDLGFLDDNMTDEDIADMEESLAGADMFVFALFYRSRAYNGSIGVSSKINDIISKLSDGKRKITVYFGNPYLSEQIDSDYSVFTFSDSLASIAAAVMKLTGKNLS